MWPLGTSLGMLSSSWLRPMRAHPLQLYVAHVSISIHSILHFVRNVPRNFLFSTFICFRNPQLRQIDIVGGSDTVRRLIASIYGKEWGLVSLWEDCRDRDREMIGSKCLRGLKAVKFSWLMEVWRAGSFYVCISKAGLVHSMDQGGSCNL